MIKIPFRAPSFFLRAKKLSVGLMHTYSINNIIVFSLMLHHPMTFVNLEKIKTHQNHQTLLPSPSLINGSENNIDNDGIKDKNDAMEIIIDDVKTATDEIEEITRKLVKSVGTDAVECNEYFSNVVLLSTILFQLQGWFLGLPPLLFQFS